MEIDIIGGKNVTSARIGYPFCGKITAIASLRVNVVSGINATTAKYLQCWKNIQFS